MQTCVQCKKEFSFDEKDHEFFRSFNVPPPRRCHPCRRRVQLVWENELLLYPRKCDLTGKPILAMYPEGVPFPVYNNSDWWGDSWDPFSYGKEIDFSRPFFEQWNELNNSIPHQARFILEGNIVNSDYINYCSAAKNCYLIFDGDFNDNCYYSYTIQNSKDVTDGLKVRESELCYECIDCLKCYKCLYCQNVSGSNECFFGYNLSNCTKCFGCVNLKNAEYHWFNEKLSRDEYEKRFVQVDLGRRSVVREWAEKFEAHKKKYPKQYTHGVNNVDCTGDYMINSKNAIECYDGFRVEDSKYCEASFLPIKECYETFECGENASRFYYSAVGGFDSYNVRWSWGVLDGCIDVDYCYYSRSIQNCFGCSNLKKAQYCILNKQYTKDEYEKLREKLIAHMKETGEWGEFFPPEYSPFAYNTSNVGIFMPLSKEKSNEKGFRWDDSADIKRGEVTEIPDSIKDVDDTICDRILADKDTGQKYKLIKQELEFYRKFNIPVPDKCFIERHKERMSKRNPKQLWSRTCDCTIASHTQHHESSLACNRPFQTTWDPALGEKVFCKECYLEEVV